MELLTKTKSRGGARVNVDEHHLVYKEMNEIMKQYNFYLKAGFAFLMAFLLSAALAVFALATFPDEKLESGDVYGYIMIGFLMIGVLLVDKARKLAIRNNLYDKKYADGGIRVSKIRD
jgi:hypothetical protein